MKKDNKQYLGVTSRNNKVIFSLNDREWEIPSIDKLRHFIKHNHFSITEVISTLCSKKTICGLLLNRPYHVSELAKMLPKHIKLICEQEPLKKLISQSYVIADMISASPKDAEYLLEQTNLDTKNFSGTDIAQIISVRPDLAITLCEKHSLDTQIRQEADLLSILKSAPDAAHLLIINRKKYRLIKTAEVLFAIVKAAPKHAYFLLHEKDLYKKIAKGRIHPNQAYAMLRIAKSTNIDPCLKKITLHEKTYKKPLLTVIHKVARLIDFVL